MQPSYQYLADTDIHVWTSPNGGQPVSLPGRTFAELIFSYVSDGEDQPQHEVQERFALTNSDLNLILKGTPGGISKSSPPYTPQELLEKSPAQLEELKIARRKAALHRRKHLREIRSLRNQVDRLQDKRDVVEGFQQAVSQAAKGTRISRPSSKEVSDSDGQIIFSFQDWHAGATARKGHNFIGFNRDVFVDRVGQLCNHIVSWRSSLNCKSPQPILYFGGDMVDDLLGQMHHDQQYEQDARGVDQLRLCADGICAVVEAAMERFPDKKIKIVALAGNHDRMKPGRDMDPERLAHWILFELVTALLKPVKDRVEIVLPRKRSDCITQCGPVRVLGWHGDGRIKPEKAALNDSIYSHGYRVMLRGHFHTRRLEEGPGYMYVTMPSLMGGSNYSANDYGYGERPGQGSVEVVHSPDGKFKIDVRFIDLR